MTEERAPYNADQQQPETPKEKLPKETFDYYLDHVDGYFPTMRHRINRMGGKSLGIRLIIEIPFEGMAEGAHRFIIGPSTIEEQLHILNWALKIWALKMEDKATSPKFKVREWKVTAGPLLGRIIISLDREQ